MKVMRPCQYIISNEHMGEMFKRGGGSNKTLARKALIPKQMDAIDIATSPYIASIFY